MEEPDLQERVKQAIVDLFGKQDNKFGYVTIGTVMERLGLDPHGAQREEVAEAMKWVAAWEGWHFVEEYGDTVSVLPRTDL